MEAGHSFGELALLTDAKRAASIFWHSDWHFATLEKDDYMETVGEEDVKALEQVVSILQGIPMFAM